MPSVTYQRHLEGKRAESRAKRPALVDRDGNRVSLGRVSPALRSAIVLIVEEGLSVAVAAQRTGYKRDSLAVALMKPHVKAVQGDIKRAWLASKTAKAWVTIANLAERAASEKVQLEAAKTILSASGELTPEGESGHGAQTLIQFIRNEFSAAQPMSHRLPGVVQLEDIQDATFEPLDRHPSLTDEEAP